MIESIAMVGLTAIGLLLIVIIIEVINNDRYE